MNALVLLTLWIYDVDNLRVITNLTTFAAWGTSYYSSLITIHNLTRSLPKDTYKHAYKSFNKDLNPIYTFIRNNVRGSSHGYTTYY